MRFKVTGFQPFQGSLLGIADALLGLTETGLNFV